MALHANFIIDTGVQIYLCDPKSHWRRGTNEYTNGLLRQYFPKRSDLKPYSQADLDQVAAELNGRPRKTWQFMAPSAPSTVPKVRAAAMLRNIPATTQGSVYDQYDQIAAGGTGPRLCELRPGHEASL